MYEIDPNDDPRSNGLCLTHGEYNGRNLSCPKCQKKEKIYNKKGFLRAQARVKEEFKDAIEEKDQQFKTYIISPSTGTVLSPVCEGPRSAWIFAAIFCDSPYSDQTIVEEN